MKIALVQDWLTGFAGGEQVLLALHEMYPDAPIYTSLYKPDKVPQFKNAKVIQSHLQHLPAFLRRDKLVIPLMGSAFERFDLKEFDIVISVGAIAKGVITHPGQRHINYCHTPIRYIWRLGGDVRNEGKWDSGLREWASHRMRLWDVISSERVDAFIANSNAVKERISKIYRRDAVVISPPVSVDRFTLSESSEDYFLTVGRLVWYKRGDLIIEAFKRFKRPLKVVGTGPEEEAFKKLADGAPNIQFLDRVSDAELEKLYAGARAFVFAAEEDAGIVPVEAMACGKPVIAYGKGGVTDVVQDGQHGILFPEQRSESLEQALTKFENMTFDPHVIRTHAEQFSKERFVAEMRAVIEEQK